MSKPTVYTDGSCYPNPGPGGWCWIDTDTGLYRHGRGNKTTNNRMELIAVIAAMDDHPGGAIIISDSQYVVNGVTKWMMKWAQRNWKTTSGPLKNTDLWRRAYGAYRPTTHRLQWVKGHMGTPGNELADAICGAARKNDSIPDTLVDMGSGAMCSKISCGPCYMGVHAP